VRDKSIHFAGEPFIYLSTWGTEIIQPTQHIKSVKVPDATPEIVSHYAPGTDEQALLTRARYNQSAC
jgi:hypothetical protein